MSTAETEPQSSPEIVKPNPELSRELARLIINRGYGEIRYGQHYGIIESIDFRLAGILSLSEKFEAIYRDIFANPDKGQAENARLKLEVNKKQNDLGVWVYAGRYDEEPPFKGICGNYVSKTANYQIHLKKIIQWIKKRTADADYYPAIQLKNRNGDMYPGWNMYPGWSPKVTPGFPSKYEKDGRLNLIGGLLTPENHERIYSFIESEIAKQREATLKRMMNLIGQTA